MAESSPTWSWWRKTTSDAAWRAAYVPASMQAAWLVAWALGLAALCLPWPRVVGETRRIVALGDIHGDYAHATAVLRAAGLLHAHHDAWAGGKTVFVSTGDTIDRGDDTIRLYQLFQRLRNESRAHGGDVIHVLGNHEMMNAMLDWRYVTPGDVASFGGMDERRDAMSLHGWLGTEWMQHYQVTTHVDLLPAADMPLYPTHRASFVHGGITPTFADMGVDAMNDVGHTLLEKSLARRGPLSKAEQALWSSDGPFWFRGYAQDPEKAACMMAEQARSSLGVYALIMGHTPQFTGIRTRCDGRVYIIDTGLSRAYGGRPSALDVKSRRWGPCVVSTFSAVDLSGAHHTLHHAWQCPYLRLGRRPRTT